MDQYILELASYESSKGLLLYPTDIDSLMKLQQSTRSNFKQFKKMIQNNECSIEELEQMVINRYGPIPNADSNMTFEETIEHYANKHDVLPQKNEHDYLLMTNALFKAFNNALIAEYEDLENESLNDSTNEIIDKPIKKTVAKKPLAKKKTAKKTDGDAK
jgi:hypothetical protein